MLISKKDVPVTTSTGTQTNEMTFDYAGGLFGPDAGTSIEYVIDQLGFGDSGHFELPFDVSMLGVAGANGELDVDYSFFAGLIGTAHLDLGSMTGTSNFAVTGTVSEQAGHAVSLTSAVSEIIENGIEVTGPSAEDTTFTVDLQTDLDLSIGGHADAWYDIFFDDGSGTLFDFGTTTLVDWHDTTNILDISAADLGGADGELFQADLGFGTLIAAVPEFEFGDAETTDLDNGLQSVTISGESSPFLSFEVDIDSFLLPVGNSFDFGFGLGFMEVAIDVGLLDAKLVANLSLGEEVTYTPTVDVTLVSDLGETLTGGLGDEMTFDTPDGEGDLTVTATYDLGVDVTTVLSLIFSTQIDWKIFYGEIELLLDIGIYSDRWSEGFAAVEGSEPLEGLGFSLDLFNDTFHYYLSSNEVTYTLHYENFVDAETGVDLVLTTNQITVVAGDGDNTITGNLLANDISGGEGADTAFGGLGDDTINGDAGDDMLHGGLNDDQVDGGIGDDTVAGNFGNDVVYGGDGDDDLRGGAGNDSLFGGDGADTMKGMAGDDVLTNGAGSDIFYGGHGADSFVITLLTDHDEIYGLSKMDTLDFRGSEYHSVEEVMADAHDVLGSVMIGGVDGSIYLDGVSMAKLAQFNMQFDLIS